MQKLVIWFILCTIINPLNSSMPLLLNSQAFWQPFFCYPLLPSAFSLISNSSQQNIIIKNFVTKIDDSHDQTVSTKAQVSKTFARKHSTKTDQSMKPLFFSEKNENSEKEVEFFNLPPNEFFGLQLETNTTTMQK